MLLNKPLPKARGPKDSPVLIIGDSLPSNKSTRENLWEILDRRHPVYNSIIVPLKYYINEYLIEKYRLKLPSDFKNKEDIFRYINAFKPEVKDYEQDNFDEDMIIEEIESNNYRIVLCMGVNVFKRVKKLFEEKYGFDEIKVKKSGGQIRELGRFFEENIKKHKAGQSIILPILHNSINQNFRFAHRFIPPFEDKCLNNFRSEYICSHEYIAENIAEIMIKDENIKKYLVNMASE